MKRYPIERHIPSVGSLTPAQYKHLAATSNGAVAQLAGTVQWVQSYIAADNTFCVYLADSEASVRERRNRCDLLRSARRACNPRRRLHTGSLLVSSGGAGGSPPRGSNARLGGVHAMLETVEGPVQTIAPELVGIAHARPKLRETEAYVTGRFG